jgi:outer membrane protein TolC
MYARAEVQRAVGVFDPVFSLYGERRRTVVPTGSALAGAAELREENNDFGTSLNKLLRTGAQFSVTFDSRELQSNSSFIGLRPQYQPELEFSITQPLLRNFGPDLTILLVRSAEAGSSSAYYQYQADVANLILEVVRSYWGVVQAKERLKAEELGLELARQLTRENEARVRAGVLAPVAVKEAQAEAASRDERVITATNGLSISRERLRLLLQRNPTGTFLPRRIEPTDSPEVRNVEPDEQATIEHAMYGRPELLRARYEIENRQIVAKVRRNNLLPSLDAYASYGLNGLSGRAIPQRDFRTGETRVTRFDGDYGRALDRLSSNDFHSYSAGLALSFPLGNAVAEAEYAEGQIDLSRSELGYQDLVSRVTLEVQTAIGNVRANSKRITASRLARELAEENLRQQERRHEVGLATTKDVLDFQEKVTSARALEIQALIDYNVSLADLRRSEGTLLGQFDVVLERLPEPERPAWAVF